MKMKWLAASCSGLIWMNSDGLPSGPTTSAKDSPSSKATMSCVEAPMGWVTMVTVPFSTSKSLMVSGMRSPFSSALTIRNWPGLAAAASLGASTTIRQMFGVSISFWIILYMVFLQSV